MILCFAVEMLSLTDTISKDKYDLFGHLHKVRIDGNMHLISKLVTFREPKRLFFLVNV